MSTPNDPSLLTRAASLVGRALGAAPAAPARPPTELEAARETLKRCEAALKVAEQEEAAAARELKDEPAMPPQPLPEHFEAYSARRARLTEARTTRARAKSLLDQAHAEVKRCEKAETEKAAADAAAARSARLPELRRRAAFSTYRAAVAPHFAAIASALATLGEAARAIDAAWRNACDAAIELQQMGQTVSALEVGHLLGPLALDLEPMRDRLAATGAPATVDVLHAFATLAEQPSDDIGRRERELLATRADGWVVMLDDRCKRALDGSTRREDVVELSRRRRFGAAGPEGKPLPPTAAHVAALKEAEEGHARYLEEQKRRGPIAPLVTHR